MNPPEGTTPKRYKLVYWKASGSYQLVEDENGDKCDYDDYAALEKKRATEWREFETLSKWHEQLMRDQITLREQLRSAERERDSLRTQLEETRARLRECDELLQAARKGQPLGPLIGAMTILNQDNKIKQLEADNEALRSAVTTFPSTYNLPQYKVPLEINSSGVLPPALILERMERCVEILAEIRKLEKTSGCYGSFEAGKQWVERYTALENEADNLLTELEVQPSAEGRE